MAGRQDGTPIAEAARLLGLSQEAVRKRLQRATLAGYKQDDHWYVLLDEQDTAAGRPDDGRTVAGRQDTPRDEPPTAPDPIEAAYRVTPADVERAVERTGARYLADMETILARVGRVYEGQLAAKDETIAELRRRAEAAEAERLAAEEERDALRLQLAEATVPPVVVVAGQEAAEVPTARDTTPAAYRPAQGLWQRLRRTLRGS